MKMKLLRYILLLLACLPAITRAYADNVPPGYSMEDPIDLGTQSCRFAYENDAWYNIGMTSKLYLYYKIHIDEPMLINVHLNKSVYIQTFIFDEQGQTIVENRKGDGNLSDIPLKVGTYYVHLTAHDKDIHLNTAITGVSSLIGNCPDVPIEIVQSPKDGSINFSDICNTVQYTDWYHGRNTNDVFFSLDIRDNLSLTVYMNHITPGVGMELTLLNDQLEKKALYEILEDCDFLMDLSPGKYYLVCEGIEMNGSFGIGIMGTVPVIPDEPDLPPSEEVEVEENYVPSANLNYIRTIVPVISNDTIRNFSFLSKAMHSVRYFDHLGRPLQEVAYKHSPTRKDIVTYHEYDGLGRDDKQWLPVVRTDVASGTFVSGQGIVSDALSSYGEQKAFSFPVYEKSPFGRIVENYGAGEAWQNTGHSNKYDYRINIPEDHCLYFSVVGDGEAPQLKLHGEYPAFGLEVTETYDEDGHCSISFTDEVGHVILERNITENDTLDTYKVYDDFGNLCFVLPPLAVYGSIEISQDIMDKYAYQYRYDYCHRCIGKKLPGCDWIEQIYDHNNRLVFGRDGEQRKRNEWSFLFSDLLDRQVVSGIYHGMLDRDVCDASDIYAIFTPESDEAYYGYKINVPKNISTDNLEILNINYYDTYDYVPCLPDFTPELNYVADKNYGEMYNPQSKLHCKDLLTGSMSVVPENGQKLYSCFYYDYYSNLIQSRHTKLNGVVHTIKSTFNFSGLPTIVCEEYGNNFRAQKQYTYDHTGRLTEEVQAIGKDTTRFVYTYDELGRDSQLTRIHGTDSLTTVNEYNIRGWVTAIRSPQFTQTLHYTNGVGTPYYNGNISSMTWTANSVTQGYRFIYDELNRMTDALYGEGSLLSMHPNRFNEQVTSYDKMGNILGLKRSGQIGANDYGLVDNLTLTYNGNHLTKVTDNAISSVYGNDFDFKDGANKEIEYEYNAKGSLIKDLNKKIVGIQYNCLNLPNRIEFENGNCISNFYDANGTKLRTIHLINGVTTTTDYCGNVIYENGVANKLLTGYGYISLNDNKYHYFIQDHQGNNRVVIAQDGRVEEVNHYYPFGGLFKADLSTQTYKYSDKELERKSGLEWYDYGTRRYDAVLGRFISVDPLVEKTYSVNPYSYCLNNPFNRVDPTGMTSHYNWNSKRYEDGAGNEVSWESVQQEYGIAENPGNDDPPSSSYVDGITGAALRVSDNAPTSTNATVVVPVLPWWVLAGQTIGEATMGYLGAFFTIITLQGDTDGHVYVNETNKVKKKSSAEADYGKPAAEHTSNKNKPEKHQKGRKRVQVDRGGEKGDTRRTRYK